MYIYAHYANKYKYIFNQRVQDINTISYSNMNFLINDTSNISIKYKCITMIADVN